MTIPLWSRKRWTGILVALISVVATFFWFRLHPVFDRNFTGELGVYLPYQIFRVLSVVFLLIALDSAGRWVASWFSFSTDELLESFILRSLLGGAFLTALYFGLGLIGGIRPVVSLIVMGPLVALGFAPGGWIDWAGRCYAECRERVVALTVLSVTAIYSLSKFFYPNFEPDSLSHYVPYYQEVISRGNILPGNVWYHFFYSKGCGLFFLMMGFVDRTGPALVNLVFHLVLIAILADLIQKGFRDRVWTWACILFLVGEIEFGHFYLLLPNKQHFIMGTLLLALVWFNASFADKTVTPADRKRLAGVNSILGVFLILFYPTAAAFAVPFLGALFLWYAWTKRPSMHYVKAILAIGGTLAGLFLVNRVLTGMFEITPFRLFWLHANQVRFSRWTSPYMMALISEGSSSAYGKVGLQLLRTFEGAWQVSVLHLEELRPLSPDFRLLFALFLVVTLVAWRVGVRLSRFNYTLIFLLALLLGVVELNGLIVTQVTSFFRMMEFSMFIVFVAVCFVYRLGIECLPSPFLKKCAIWVFLIAGVFFSMRNTIAIAGPKADFLIGRQTYAGVAVSERKFVKGAFAAKEALGLETRLFSFVGGLGEIGFLPGRKIETDIDFSYREWHCFLFCAPEEAEAALRREGLNYFIFSLESFQDSSRLAMTPTSLLLFSPLFDESAMKEHFKIAFNDGDTFVLTWKQPGESSELSPEFWDQWRSKDNNEKYARLYGRLKQYYERFGEKYPLKADPSWAPIEGWQ